MLLSNKEIEKVISGKFDKTLKKNKLGTIGYLNVRNFQLKSNFFSIKEIFPDIQEHYNYLYSNIFTTFLNKSKKGVFNVKDFEDGLDYEAFIKYTIKAVLKNEEGKNFFTYLNKWIFKFINEYYKKRKIELEKECYLDDIKINFANYKASGPLFHNKETEKTNIKFALEEIITDLEGNKVNKKVVTLLKKINNKIKIGVQVTDTEYKKILKNLPESSLKKLKTLLIS